MAMLNNQRVMLQLAMFLIIVVVRWFRDWKKNSDQRRKPYAETVLLTCEADGLQTAVQLPICWLSKVQLNRIYIYI